MRQKHPQICRKIGIWTTPGKFTLLFLQFYQSFSISYIEIGVNLNLREIFGHETNACVWEMQTFDWHFLKTANICLESIYFLHVSQKYNKLLWFSWKTLVCTMYLIKRFFPWAWKSTKNAHCLPGKDKSTSPRDLSSFFHWKKLFWTDFHISPKEPISTQQIQSKDCF